MIRWLLVFIGAQFLASLSFIYLSLHIPHEYHYILFIALSILYMMTYEWARTMWKLRPRRRVKPEEWNTEKDSWK